MPGLDTEVARHHLSIDPALMVVAQRKRKKTSEKVKVAKLAVKDLLEEHFICEA